MMDQLFSSANLIATIGWILLIVAPRWRWTERLVLSGFWSLALAALYLALIVRFFPESEGGFGSIAQVRMLFSQDGPLLAGWVHYLAFDLLVGAFEVKQARAAGIHHAFMVPILVLTFMLGPIGLFAFFVVKSAYERRPARVIP
jgi:hypothetical protein